MWRSRLSILEGHRDGQTYDPVEDYARLNAQHRRVYFAMANKGWMTLGDISHITGDPQASISARIRDFRKERFGSHFVLRRYLGDGLWEYRLVWRPSVPRPEEDNADLPN